MVISRNMNPPIFPKVNLVPCSPPAWARSGHAQTVWGHLLPSSPLPPQGKKVEIELPDGDRLVTFHHRGAGNTVVYLFHGLGGDSSADYMQRTAQVCSELGHSFFLVNHRGCGEGEGLARGPYHSGRAEDISKVIETGRKLHPDQKHLAVGFSLSGNALLLLLSGRRGAVLPDCAISVNAPIDLATSAQALQRGITRLYDLRFVRLCQQSVISRERRGLLQNHYRFPWFSTLSDFDEIYTAPESGFRDREDYYRTCSTKDLLAEIRTPTVLLTSADDPIVSHQLYLQAKLSPSIHLHIEKVGGHMGYISKKRTPLGTRRWLDYALHNYIQSFQNLT